MNRGYALAAGLALLMFVWAGPLRAAAVHSFAAHMLLHMSIVAVAAPLIAIGMAGSRLDPVMRAPGMFSAVPASVIEMCAVWAWHAPALHEVARADGRMFAAEQLTFLGAGWFLWMSIFGGDPAQRITRAGVGAIALLVTFAHMTLLGALLALTPRALFTHGHGAGGAAASIADQQTGGAIMLVVTALACVGGGLWLSWQLLRTSPRADT